MHFRNVAALTPTVDRIAWLLVARGHLLPWIRVVDPYLEGLAIVGLPKVNRASTANAREVVAIPVEVLAPLRQHIREVAVILEGTTVVLR